MRPTGRALAMAGLAALAAAAPASAATWHRVTPKHGGNIDEVGLLRTADGVLHAAWVQTDAANPDLQEDIATRTISVDGTSLGPVSLIVGGWAAVSNPALTAGPGGLRAFFGGIRTTISGEPNDDLSTAVSSNGGSSWALQIGNVSRAFGAYEDETSAVLLPSGTPMIAGGTGSEPFVTTGLTPGAFVFHPQSQLGANYGIYPALTVDASGTPYLTWASQAPGKEGIWAQPLHADATPAAPPLRMPGVVGSDFAPQSQRTPIAARAGGGVYIAYPGGYPSTRRVQLWKVGAAKSTTVAKGPGDHNATVTATGDGRLWILWSGQDGRISATRTNKAANHFGAVVSAGAPHGSSRVFRLGASAAPGGGVDILALTDAGHVSTWQRRLLPGLTLKASPKHVHGGATTKVTFHVLDAGAPVQGAKIAVAGHQAKTTKSGAATIAVPAGTHAKHVTAKASHAGYTTATLRLSVT